MKHEILKQKIGDMLELAYEFNLEIGGELGHGSKEVNKYLEGVRVHGNEFAYYLLLVYVELERIDRRRE